jgi:hypothetical protein
MTMNHQGNEPELNPDLVQCEQLGTPTLRMQQDRDPKVYTRRVRNEEIRILNTNGNEDMTQERSDQLIWYYLNPRNGGQEDSLEEAAWRKFLWNFMPQATMRLEQPDTTDPYNAHAVFNLICCSNSDVSTPIFMTDLRRWKKERNLPYPGNDSPTLRFVLAPRRIYRRVVEEFFDALYFQYEQEPINGLAIESLELRMLACAVFQSQEAMTINRAAHDEQ